MLFVTTRMDHTFAHANLDILEMDATVQVQSIISEAFIFLLTITMNFLSLVVVVFFLSAHEAARVRTKCREKH